MAQTAGSADSSSTSSPRSTGRSGDDAIRRAVQYGADEIIEILPLPGHPEILVSLDYRKSARKPMPVFLGFLGQRERKIEELLKDAGPATQTLAKGALPDLSEVHQTLVDRGCALVNFVNTKPPEHPWPEGKARWVWPTPDPAGAEAFAQTAMYAPGDFATVIDYVETRADLRRDRIGYLGGSTTALIGYGLISKEPRITCAVLGAGSGYLTGFVEGWARNYHWKDKGFKVWKETKATLKEHDPILFVDRIYPRALLMTNGAKDWLIPIESVRHYFEALFPYYADDPARLQLIVFEGAGHGWDPKWNTFMILDWLDRYLIQDTPPKPMPRPKEQPKTK